MIIFWSSTERSRNSLSYGYFSSLGLVDPYYDFRADVLNIDAFGVPRASGVTSPSQHQPFKCASQRSIDLKFRARRGVAATL